MGNSMPGISGSSDRAAATERAAYSYGVVREFMETSSGPDRNILDEVDERAAREAIVELSWEAARGSQSASGLLRLLSEEPHAMAAEAREIWERQALFSELARTDDPVAFAQKLDGYLDGITQGLLQRLRDGVDGREGVRRYAEALQYGPANFILQLFHRQFAERLETHQPQDQIAHVVRHDYLNPIISSTMLFMFWDREFAPEALDRLGALERLRGKGPELLVHAAKALFPRALNPAVQENELGIELPIGLPPGGANPSRSASSVRRAMPRRSMYRRTSEVAGAEARALR